MSDRFSALVVTLERDMKDEDGKGLIEAISRLRGVLSVKPNVSNIEQQVAEDRVRHEISRKLFAVLHPELAKEPV